jgi:hypothetical protein
MVDHVIIFGDLRPQNSEPRKLEEVARLASGWFRCYFLIKERNLKTDEKENPRFSLIPHKYWHE